MASGASAARSARVVSRNPASTRVSASNRSMVAFGGDAFGQLVSTEPGAQAQQSAGTLVPMEGQGGIVPMGLGDEGLDDVEEWETSPSVPVLVDAVGEFNRACQGEAMPIQDVGVAMPPGVQTPLRRPGTQSMAEQSRRTRSPRSALLSVVPAGRPPTATQAYLPMVQVPRSVAPSWGAMPTVPLMPGNSPGASVDMDDLLAGAVETEFFYKPELDHYEAQSDALKKEVSESSKNVATLVAELRLADQRANRIESIAVSRYQGLRDEEHQRMSRESVALLHYSHNHEREMASQRSGAETRHIAIVSKQREEFNELMRNERAQLRVIREEAAFHSSQLAGQLATERQKCQELEVMAQQQLQTVSHGASNVTNHLTGQVAIERQRYQDLEFMAEQQVYTLNQVYVADVQALRVSNSALLAELNLANERLARCQQEVASREAMLQDGGSKATGLLRELNELKEVKTRFEAWVSERLTTEKAAMTAAQGKILALEKEVDDLQTHGAVQTTAVFELTDELGQARVRVDALTRENQALRAKLAAAPLDVPRGAGMASFMLSTSPERENDELEGAYGFEEPPAETPPPKASPEKLLKGKRDALEGDPPPSPPSSSSSTSSSSWGRGRSDGRRGRSERRKKEKREKLPPPKKEADSITVPALPKNAAQFSAWKEAVRNKVVAASGRSREAFLWMLDVEEVTVSYEKLAEPGSKNVSLDDKLRAAITDVCAGELGKELNRAAEDEKVKFRRPLAGRQMLRLIYVYFQTKQSLNQVYGLTNLMKVNYLGDKNMEQFYNSWLKVVNNLKSPDSVSAEAREELFLKACEQSAVLKNDVDHYKRQVVGHPDKSYDFLLRSMKFRIDSAREDRNLKELDNTFAGSSTIPAMPSADGMCKFFLKGSCLKGNDCKFSHGGKGKGQSKDNKGDRGNARVPSPGSKGGKGYKGDSGKSKGAGKSGAKKLICYRYMEGTCPKTKEECSFDHRKGSAEEVKEKASWDAKRAASPAPQADTKICPDWKNKGECALGDACKLAHPKKGRGKGKRAS